MSILVHRLTRLIELHADALAATLEARIASSERCATYSRVSGDELKTAGGRDLRTAGRVAGDQDGRGH